MEIAIWCHVCLVGPPCPQGNNTSGAACPARGVNVNRDLEGNELDLVGANPAAVGCLRDGAIDGVGA